MYDTIFAPVTTIGSSAVSVFRISGKDSAKILKALIKEKKLPVEKKLVLKKVYHPKSKKELLDICMICWMPSPNSYTGEDSFEVHCHGGFSTSKAFIDAFSKVKELRFAEAGEFSKRALINGKIDLIKAEAVNQIIIAESENQRNLSVRQLEKGLSIPVSSWKKQIIKTLSKLEATIDFSDEEAIPEKLFIKNDLNKIINQIKKVLKEGEKYDVLVKGLKVVITGSPNVGKSSLFNYIIKKEKSIVTKIAGTTRDVVDKKIILKGNPVTFYDTAGIRKTKGLVEKEGIKKALNVIEEADILLTIYDINKVEENKVLEGTNKKWNIFNKIDKKKNTKRYKDEKKINTYFVSVKTGEGIKGLLEDISTTIIKKTKELKKEDYFYTNSRQKNDLKKAIENLRLANLEKDVEIIAEYLRTAIYNLERILGKVDIEDVLGEIFSSFCIGK